MAKFFPFIVETSTPIHIYQAILSRSKGINNVLVTSIFWLILSKGITPVRELAKTFPESMGLPEIYEELLSNYPGFHIPIRDFKLFQVIGPYLEQLNINHEFVSDKLKDYDINDVMSFLLVTSISGNHEEYTNLPFHKLHGEEYFEKIQDFCLFSSKNRYNTRIVNSLEDLHGYFHLYGPLLYERFQAYPVNPKMSPLQISDYSIPDFKNSDSQSSPDSSEDKEEHNETS